MSLYGYPRPTPEPLPQADRHLVVDAKRGWHYATYAERAANAASALAKAAPLGSRADEQRADALIEKMRRNPADTGAVALGEQLARDLTGHPQTWQHSGEPRQLPGAPFSHDYHPTTALHEVPMPSHIPDASAGFGHYRNPAA